MQVAGAAIIAETFPETQHGLLVGRGEVHYGRKRGDETQEVRNNRNNLRLLKHDLADPDAIRITVHAPRKVALVPIEPGEQAATDPETERGWRRRRESGKRRSIGRGTTTGGHGVGFL